MARRTRKSTSGSSQHSGPSTWLVVLTVLSMACAGFCLYLYFQDRKNLEERDLGSKAEELVREHPDAEAFQSPENHNVKKKYAP